MSPLRIFLPVALATLVACASGTSTESTMPHAPSAADVRARAARSPNDPDLQRRAATLELLAYDGDPSLVGPTLERALTLSPDDAALHLLHGLALGLHGEADASDEEVLRALELARTSTDPLAPFVAEYAANELTIDVGDEAVTSERRRRARAVFDAPGHIGPFAMSALSSLLIGDAARRGAGDEARAIAEAQGCVRSYRVAGPFGPREQLGFDHDFAASGTGPMADEYDLGPVRGRRATRTIQAGGCAIWLGGGAVQGPGTNYAESFIDVPADTEAYILLSTPNSVSLRLDGREIARVDHRDATAARETIHRVTLTAGRHELEAKVTTRHPSPVLEIDVVGADGRAISATTPTGRVSEMPSGEDALSLYLRSRLAHTRGDVVQGREHLRRLFDGDEASPLVLTSFAASRFSDPMMPADRATDEARSALRKAQERDAAAWYPVLELAQLAASEGRPDEAIDGLRAAESRFPEVVGISLTLVGLLEEKGFTAEAERRLRALATRRPGDCSVISSQRDLAESMGRVVATRDFAEELVRCDARSSARLDRRMAARDWAGADEELTRLESIDLDGDPSNFWAARLRLAHARHDDAAERELLARIADRWPRADAPVLAAVDERVAAGDLAGAVAILDRAIEREPTSLAGMRRLRADLAMAHTMEPYRLDGLRAIEEYRASGQVYDAPAVYVLDYAAVRIFPDGSYLYLVHQVVEVNSEAALDEVGEFHPPEGEILRARTIKADGTILEPDAIAGLQSLALPRLEVGDFVETEYVLYQGPAEALEGGVLSHRFYFQSFDGPLHRTEYVVVAPDDLAVTFDRRGPLPEPQLEARDGLTLRRFRMDHQPKPEPEPFAVNPREYLPSVSWGIGARWGAMRDMLADQLIDTMPRDPELVRLAEGIVRDAHARTDRQKAVALFRWVSDEIESEGSGLFESAPAMVYDRNGNRDRVLQYLLRLVGIPVDVVLVRSTEADQTPSELPEDDTYDGYALRITLGGEPVYVTASQRGVPFGWIPPTWLGQPGFLLVEGGADVVLPAASPIPDRRDVVIEAELEDTGRARLVVTETLSGASAASWRNDLESTPAAELEMRFESGYVAPRFPGAALQELEIRNQHDYEQPLVIAYTVESDLAFPDASGAVLELPMPFEIGGSLASTAVRRTTAQIPMVASSQTLRVRLPSSFGPGTLPTPADLSGPSGSRFTASARMVGTQLVIERTLDLHRSRIAPADYAALATFARSCDREESRPIRLVGR